HVGDGLREASLRGGSAGDGREPSPRRRARREAHPHRAPDPGDARGRVDPRPRNKGRRTGPGGHRLGALSPLGRRAGTGRRRGAAPRGDGEDVPSRGARDTSDRRRSTVPGVHPPPSSVTRPGSLARNALYLVLGQVGTMLLGVLFNAALGRTLGAGDFGLYFLISSFAAFALVLVDWGQQLFGLREVARAPQRGYG